MTVIIVQSHDGHRKNWPGWYWHWKKKWKAGGVVIFVTEEVMPEFDDPEIHELPVGRAGFSEVLFRAIATPYMAQDRWFMHMLGDHWLTREISVKWLQQRFHLAKLAGMGALRIDPPKPYKTHPEGALDDVKIHRLLRDSPYLSSFQPAIYRTGFLLSYLDRAEDPWAGELEGTKRIRFMTKGPHSDVWLLDERIVHDTMRRGGWMADKPHVHELMKEAGLVPQT